MKPDAWSFVPPAHSRKFGDGPFRVRGTVYAGNVERVQKTQPGGLPAICAEIGIPAVEAYLCDTIFLATSLYDIEPLMHLMRATSKKWQIPLDKLLRQNSRFAGEQDVAGMYKAQLRSASAQEMAARLPRIFARYFDPCRAESLAAENHHADMRFSGLPASALGFYVWLNEGFVTGAMQAIGVKDVRFSWLSATPDGDLDSVPLQSITSRITWTT